MILSPTPQTPTPPEHFPKMDCSILGLPLCKTTHQNGQKLLNKRQRGLGFRTVVVHVSEFLNPPNPPSAFRVDWHFSQQLCGFPGLNPPNPPFWVGKKNLGGVQPLGWIKKPETHAV
jgi:hypothetical protein